MTPKGESAAMEYEVKQAFTAETTDLATGQLLPMSFKPGPVDPKNEWEDDALRGQLASGVVVRSKSTKAKAKE